MTDNHPGGFIPGPGGEDTVTVTLAPDECVINRDEHGRWRCGRNHVPRPEWARLLHPNREATP